MTRQKVTISLEPELVQKIDDDRGLIPRSRYIEKLLKETTENKSPQTPPYLSNPVLTIPGPTSPDHTSPRQTGPNLK